jgi:hypothetical protein
MPYVFQVLTRALVALCSFYILGLCLMYVDNIMGVLPIHTAALDMVTVNTQVTGLLGPAAIAHPKDECERAFDWVGWYVNLDLQSVTLSRRKLLKTVYAFFCFRITDKVTRTQVETMASLASRYSQLSRPILPYTDKHMYDTIGHYKDKPYTRTPTPR